MNQVQDTSSISALLGSNDGSIQAARKTDDDTQERFLKLLVTQMQNQDPLNPMDNAEVTSQIAQISTVTGIDKLNVTLEKLVANSDARRSMEAAMIIGRNVLVPGERMDLSNHTGIGGFELAEPADKVIVTVKDSSGVALRDIELGAQPAGVGTFGWDGLAASGDEAADGHYSFSVTALRGEEEVAVTTLSFGAVSSAAAGNEGDAQLEVGELGYFGMDTVRKIF